jgi:hypothetical protein
MDFSLKVKKYRYTLQWVKRQHGSPELAHRAEERADTHYWAEAWKRNFFSPLLAPAQHSASS